MKNNKCSNCNEEFENKAFYDEHVKYKACVLRLFINKEHYQQYDKIPSYLSTHCSFKRMIGGTLIHNLTHTQQNPDESKELRIFKCKYCDNVFSRIDSLGRHNKKFCKVKKELDILKIKNQHLEDDKNPEDLESEEFDMDEFKDKFDVLMQNYIENRKI